VQCRKWVMRLKIGVREESRNNNRKTREGWSEEKSICKLSIKIVK
jgi:hypothetical protein